MSARERKETERARSRTEELIRSDRETVSGIRRQPSGPLASAPLPQCTGHAILSSFALFRSELTPPD